MVVMVRARAEKPPIAGRAAGASQESDPPTCGVQGLGRRNRVGPHKAAQLLLQLVAEVAELLAAQDAIAVGVGIVEAFDRGSWRGSARVGRAFWSNRSTEEEERV